MINIFAIGIGGFIGAVLRYLFTGWIYRLAGTSLPWGTLVVNVAGSFILGFFLVFEMTRLTLSPALRNFVAIGILGAFTTFSTFSYEAVNLIQDQLYMKALFYILLNVIISIIAVWFGMVTARIMG
ncbi:MAG: fluoride efflux transporter CrcB [Calditrichaceae bacterium]|nr:fluoride efflux transporter CrcB [Calditrichaceae bacterium]MBN2709345.1 fluoride efflux transporter CrcB [Calditrichaceae bacterium]RQV94677.1 MAG: fluoride efflux transporter CrcB [Calditrichota bacterium]